MILTTKYLKLALDELGINYESLHYSDGIIKVEQNGKIFLFHRLSSILNNSSTVELLNDKEFFYLASKEYVKMPKTLGYFNPFASSEYNLYKKFVTLEEILLDIKKNFFFPLILKPNKKNAGKGVKKINNFSELEAHLKAIFYTLDYVAIVQEFIDIKKEYRAIFLNGELELLYEKDISNAVFSGNLSPLHWQNAKAIEVNSMEIKDSINKFAGEFLKKLFIRFTGCDILLDKNDVFWLIEANARPGFSIFERDNGVESIKNLFIKCIKISLDEKNKN